MQLFSIPFYILKVLLTVQGSEIEKSSGKTQEKIIHLQWYFQEKTLLWYPQ
jgi:hypothetical protein